MTNRMTPLKWAIMVMLACTLAWCVGGINGEVAATSATSYTQTLDRKGQMVRTQDAYLPDRTVMHLELSSAEDIFINDDGYILIADSGNRRVVVYDPATDELVQEITHERFQTPRGVFVSAQGELYVADTAAESLIVFDESGEFIRSYDSIESPSFNRPFRPMKVSVDVSGNIYVLGEGVYDGIIQLSAAGEFLGFFTSNRVNLSFIQMLQELFFTEAQLANLFDRAPQTFSNLFTDKQGILYTSTIGGNLRQSVKKHNTAGANMLNESLPVNNILDLYTDAQGIIYTATSDGYINIYSSEGEFIYMFGASVQNVDVAGIFDSLRSIAVDADGNIWTLDINKGVLQSFSPTEYAASVYHALASYNQGQYGEAITFWQEALRLNQMSVLAHNNIARNYFSQQNYPMTMYHAEIAGNRFYYSEAFWETRNAWLQDHIAIMMIAIVALVVAYFVIRAVHRRTGLLAPLKTAKAKVGGIRPISDVGFAPTVMRHPNNAFYELKKFRGGTLLGAVILYVLFFIVWVFSIIGVGFIHRTIDPTDFSLPRVAILYFGLTLLFVTCNYLVTSLHDGEGSWTDIFRVLAFSSVPLMIALFINTLLSYLVTENEIFILTFITVVGLVWSALLLVIGLTEIHVYEPGEMIKSLLMTFAFMIIIVLVGTLFVVMGEMLFQFIVAIVKEGVRNVVG